MLKALIKKQFKECFRAYFVNTKKNKARSKAGTFGMFTLFTLLMVFVAGMFFGLSYLIGDPLMEMKLSWLFFTIMGILSIMLGVFGSVFNTYAALYLAKDNELLLAMPIKPSEILLSRMTLVYGLSLLYSGIVWIPALLFTVIFGKFTAISLIFGLLLFPVIALFVTVLTCLLGWIVALIASRVRNRSFLVVFLTMILLGGYYVICFNMSSLAEAFIKNIGKMQEAVKQWGGMFYYLGMAADGDVKYMLLFCGITAILTVLCIYILSKTFTTIVTKAPESGRNHVKLKDEKAHSLKSALFQKELKRFTSSPTYMLNCGMGMAFLLVGGIFSLIKRELLEEILSVLLSFVPEVEPYVPFAIIVIVCALVAMNMVSTPSVSLEGKNLWIVHTLPVTGKDVMQAKLNLHVMLNIVPAFLAILMFCYSFKVNVFHGILVLAFSCLYIWLTGALGLIIGVLRPNFQWTSETMPIKQSLNVLIIMLLNILIMVLLLGSYYFLWKHIEVQTHIILCIVVLLLGSFGATYWLNTKGAARFEKL